MKKRVVCFLIAVTLLCLNCTACKKEKNQFADYVDFVVEVERGRDIRVLQLTDIQIIDSEQMREGREGMNEDKLSAWKPEKTEQRLFGYIREVLSAYTPDLIIITGDLVYGEFDDNGSSFIKMVEFFDSCKIPWAPVFGNHDNESKMGADWQCRQLENSEYCLFKQRNLTGNGNYSVGLVQDNKLVRVFYMLDSNGCSSASEQSLSNKHTVKESGFAADQIEYYTQSISKVKADYPNVKASLAFHIPLEVANDAISNGSGDLTRPFDFEKDENDETIGYYDGVPRDFWDARRRVWLGIKDLEIVDSMFFGHEHTNSASVVYDGIRLAYGLKTGAYAGINCVGDDGSIVYDSLYIENTIPMCGGTAIIVKADGKIDTYHIYNSQYID